LTSQQLSRSARKSFLARDLLRISPCEFLLQVAAPRWIDSRVQSD